MKIFIAGATGALGRQLVPMLVAKGHTVIGTARTAQKADALRVAGGTPVLLDALDRDAVVRTLVEVGPEVVVHQLTALAEFAHIRKFEESFAVTNRLRTEATDHLLEGARRANARRFVVQSYAGPGVYERTGGPIKTEGDPLDPNPPSALRPTYDAIRYLERSVMEAEWIKPVVLRYGGWYGPGTSLGHGSAQVDAIRRRRFPVVGEGSGVWSFIHIQDVAGATVAAIDGDEAGIFNIVDDEPAPVAEWLPFLANALGAKPPRSVPTWLARLFVGEPGVVMMTESRGASNAKAKRDLGWRLRYPSWRDGFIRGLNPKLAGAVA